MTLDEHGILYVYSNSPIFAELFIRYGFEERKEKLISDLGHWHIFPAAAERLRSKLINALNLKKIGGTYEETQHLADFIKEEREGRKKEG